jgi:hypothetical protein
VESNNKMFQILKEDTKSVLNSNGFLHAEHSTLVMILEQDHLRISSEVELFSACLRWAENHIQENRSALGIVETLKPVLPLIRFRTMTAKEFATAVVPCNILTKIEIADIFYSIITENEDLPAGLCNNVNPRDLPRCGPRETLMAMRENLSLSYDSGMRYDYVSGNEHNLALISSNVSAYCFGVHVIAARLNESSLPLSYNENVKVVLINEGGSEKASGTFNGQVHSGNSFIINFDRPVTMLPNTEYVIQVIYAETGIHYMSYALHSSQLSFSCGGILSIDGSQTHVNGIDIAKKIV